ncbi:Endonuclease MutS2 [bioreactor metagenome]|uniref:Endonuclease MutS2 n=1 Tax=bioreactor metagenome TaxID=1076179 RepID=A0A644VTI6_9ZZZZ
MELNYCVNLYSFLMMRNNKLELKIGFDQVRESLKVMCLSDGGRSFVERMEFVTSYNKVIELLGITEEFRQIFITNEVFPSDNYFDMRGELQRLKLLGTFISQESLFDLKSSLITINECLLFFSRSDDNKFPLLSALSQGVYVDKNLLNICAKLLDSKGDFNDDASEYLYIIRSNHRKKVLDVDKQIKRILNQVKKEGWSSEEAEVTVRNGRLVIPISSANKKRIKGFIHDESQSGQTSYIEPAEIVELNNEIRELELEERREILKILVEFTDVLRPEIDNLINAYYFLSKIDFIRAKAKYALQIKAGKPIVEDNTLINWFEARHPILEEALEKNSKKIVPLRIELNSKDRILIISGPNAGGKSVCLKTVGLLQYMLQCGLLVPMRESSEAGIFSSIFIDIGDEQSIENDLSTYSSHLLSMKNLCERANNKTLFLIDECGTGTDPTIGGAIAESVLEFLNEKQAFGVVTTHYSNLKLLADRHASIINGAMLFDQNNMRPLYKLSIGKPGSSFAFEIAQTIGLPKQIVDKAVDKIGSSYLDFEQQLQQLEVDKIELRKKEQEVKVADDLLSEVLLKYNKLSSELEDKKRVILKQAKIEAKEILQNASRQIENTISQIKEANANKEKTKKIREEFSKEQIHIDRELSELEKQERKNVANKDISNKSKDIGVKIDLSPIAIGDIVKIGDENTFAEVVSIKRNRLEVISNSVKMSIEKNKVIKVDKKSFLKSNAKLYSQKQSAFLSVIDELNEKRKTFKTQLDLRGERAEDALDKLSQFIDQARLLGEREISVLHGKGDGILKTIIRDFLKTNSEIKTFKSARLEFGGEGITMITLN